MDLDQIEAHWTKWAKEFQQDIRATTKTRTIKYLEVDALYRAIKKTEFFSRGDAKVLEVGCGNGHNCFMLAKVLPRFSFTGVDFILDMVNSALEIRNSSTDYSGMNFFQGNVLKLDECENIADQYDIVFTDRCLINLNTHELQRSALDQLYEKVAPGGYLILIENVQSTYERQNIVRKSSGLEPRTPDSFNLFIDEESFLRHAKTLFSLLAVEDFAALHDLVLYVLQPMMNGGKINYEDPMIQSVTDLLLAMPDNMRSDFGSFGQNRLYFFKKD
ncbi:methyltransferase domain-containing protein [Thalassolituus oleivorans]|uniref:methyltransferase domain-containing protein n=1 Tax=Thalassolituus oleivorans TaxID=187493 RepID=UPI002409EE19|nr:class I SAM-dependent methyltransferase [Thalassolituus oleivorans]MDF1642008.1 class I SAM-dependent methyltransferase [Thalassolituus oleivorans]